jgi:hypothetical protein
MSEAASTRKRKPTEESEAVVVVSDDTLDVGPVGEHEYLRVYQREAGDSRGNLR